MAEQRLSQVLTKKLGIYVPVSEIHYETIWFMKEEVDEELVPAWILSPLADPIISDSASYTDAEGTCYLVLIIETGFPEPYEVWLVNDEVVPNFADEMERGDI